MFIEGLYSEGMFGFTYAQRLRAARERAKLSQRKAAEACGMSRSRLSRLELGVTLPSRSAHRLLKKTLGLAAKFPQMRASYRGVRLKTRGRFPAPRPFIALGDRPIQIRFRAARARHQSLVERWVSRIRTREDFADVHYVASRLQADSYAEVLFMLRLLEAGAEPVFLPLGRLGWLPVPAVKADSREEIMHRPLPALYHQQVVYFFQVAFATPQIRRVDVLAWHTDDKAWVIYEIDGAGHESDEDKHRSAVLRLPVFRLKPESICRPDFVERFVADAAWVYRRNAYWPTPSSFSE